MSNPKFTELFHEHVEVLKAHDKTLVGVVIIYMHNAGQVPEGTMVKLGVDVCGDTALKHESYAAAATTASKIILQKGKPEDFVPMRKLN